MDMIDWLHEFHDLDVTENKEIVVKSKVNDDRVSLMLNWYQDGLLSGYVLEAIHPEINGKSDLSDYRFKDLMFLNSALDVLKYIMSRIGVTD